MTSSGVAAGLPHTPHRQTGWEADAKHLGPPAPSNERPCLRFLQFTMAWTWKGQVRKGQVKTGKEC
jgi:hypothetical protein